MTEYVNLITNVGFPIACCMGIAYYTAKTTHENKEELTKTNEKLQEIIEKTTECISNNTNALKELIETMKKE